MAPASPSESPRGRCSRPPRRRHIGTPATANPRLQRPRARRAERVRLTRRAWTLVREKKLCLLELKFIPRNFPPVPVDGSHGQIVAPGRLWASSSGSALN